MWPSMSPTRNLYLYELLQDLKVFMCITKETCPTSSHQRQGSPMSLRLLCLFALFKCLLCTGTRHWLWCVLNGKRWQWEQGISTRETAWEMNERRTASQIRFVFQSSSGHIPYWLKPNNLIRCSPPPFSSSTIPPSFFLSSCSSLLPSSSSSFSHCPQRETTRRLCSHY